MARTLRRLPALLVPLVLGAAGAGAEPGDAQEITLSRSARVGQRFVLRVEAQEERSVTALARNTEQVVYDHEVSVELLAEAEVLAVDAAGRPLRMAYRIDHCREAADDCWRVVVPRGAYLVAQRDDRRTLFEVDGSPPACEVRRSLELMLGFESFFADDLAGVTGRRHPGEAWSIEPGPAVEGVARRWGVRPQAEDVSGAATFVDVHPIDGRRCMRIRHQLTVANLLPDREAFPPEFEVSAASLETVTHGLYPEDPGLPARGLSTRTKRSAVLTGAVYPSGPSVELHLGASRSVFRDIRPVEDGPDPRRK